MIRAESQDGGTGTALAPENTDPGAGAGMETGPAERVAQTPDPGPPAGPSATADTEDFVRRLLAAYDRVEDALQVVECRCGASKRQRKRHGPFIRALRIVQGALVEALEGLHTRPMPLTERVDYALHEPVAVLITPQACQDGRVVEVVRRGFVRGRRVIRLQQVVTLKYAPPPGGEASAALSNYKEK